MDATDTSRRVLTTAAQAQLAVLEVAKTARRSLALLTHALEPPLYAQLEFVEVAKALVLARRFARVRVLLADPTFVVQHGHRLVEAGRRLSSFFEFRRVHPDYAAREDGFLVADDANLLHLQRATHYYGVATFREHQLARRYLGEFDEIWSRSGPDEELRRLSL